MSLTRILTRLSAAMDSRVTPAMCYSVYILGDTHKKKLKRQDKDMDWAKPLAERKAKQATKKAEPEKPPHMLHVVIRVKTTSGRPWWEKDIIKQLKLDGPMNHPVVHKNIPGVNKRLLEVKHLVQIMPLTFPHGLPEHESDFEHTMLKSNGELLVKKRLPQYEPPDASDEPDPKEKWRMTPQTLKKHLDDIRIGYKVHTEYNKTHHVYKLNQDGQEYRYAFHRNNPKYRF